MTSEKIKQVCELMRPIIEDPVVPRNIRKAISDAQDKLLKSAELDVAIANAVYVLDEAANDVNVPLHARTDIWNVISELERLKEELKR